MSIISFLGFLIRYCNMGLRCNNYVVISRNFNLVSWSSYIISRYCNVIPRCIVSIYLSIYLTIYLFVYIYLFVHIYLTIYLSIYMFLHLSIYLFISAAGYIKPPPARLMHDTPSANSFNFIFSNYYKPKNLHLWNVFFGFTSVPAWYDNYESKIKLDPISIGLFYPIWIGGN